MVYLNGRPSLSRWFSLGIAAVALFGSIIAAVSSIHSGITENRFSIEDIRQEIINLDRRSEAADKEIRDSIRLLASKVIDKKSCGCNDQ